MDTFIFSVALFEDANGKMRLPLTLVTASGLTAQFMYDDGNLVKKINPNGSKTLYVGGIYAGLDRLDSAVDKASGGSVTRTVTYYPVGGAMRINNTLYYILKDHLGSASVVTDSSGVEVGEQRYYPFGETRLTTGTIYTDKLFTGQREMAGLGIYHYQARFYSPKLGRFLSADTIVPSYGSPQSLNRFSYVLNNPLGYIDPSGNLPIDCYGTNYCGSSNSYKLPDPPGGTKVKNKKLREDFGEFEGLPTYAQSEMIPTTFVTVGPYSLVKNLTPDEYRMFLSGDGTLNNFSLFEFGVISQSAKETARSLFPSQPEGNNPRNAVQHALWSALLTRRFGSQFAENVTTAHESEYGAVREAQFMDLHNNEIGRRIAEANPHASAPYLQDLVLDALENGALVVLENDNIYFSDQCPQSCIYP